MKFKKLKNQLGFAVAEILAGIVIIGVVVAGGVYVATRSHALSPNAAGHSSNIPHGPYGEITGTVYEVTGTGTCPATNNCPTATRTPLQTTIAIKNSAGQTVATVTSSSKDGTFSEVVKKGTYSVVPVTASGAVAPGFSPNTQSVTVKKGEVVNVTFNYYLPQPTTSAKITGTVYEVTGGGTCVAQVGQGCSTPATIKTPYEVKIAIINSAGLPVATVTSSATDGTFSAPVSPGTYIVQPESSSGTTVAPGFSPSSRTVSVQAGGTATVELDYYPPNPAV